jgi:4-oxalocrotonate tautomerase
LTDLTETILRKKRNLTAVIIEPVRADLWSIGETALSEMPLATFALVIKVTRDTNTDDEKAAYVRAVFGGMQDLLGRLHEASYVIVDEVPAAAWGYGGRTQADRFAA